jgi:hypothetical protein
MEIQEINIVLVSNFDELMGVPFLTRQKEFSGKVYMT